MAKKPVPEPIPRLDPFSDAGLADMATKVVPLVEAAAGRAFLTPPVVRFAVPDEFHNVLVSEERRIFAQVLPDTPAEMRERMAVDTARVEAAGVLGKYGIEDHVTYLCPSAIRDSLPQMGLDDDQSAEVLQLILAHELTHALTDQHTQLSSQLTRMHDLDALKAAGSAWEGVATWTEQRVAAKLGLTPLFDSLTGLQGWGPNGRDPRGPFSLYATYGLGRDFTAWHFDHGGFDAVWATLADPPRSTSAIFRPSRWGIPVQEPIFDAAALLRGLEQEITTGPWIVSNSRLGELSLREDAVNADAEEALEGILSHLEWAQVLNAERPDRQAELRIISFDSHESVQEWLDLLRNQQTASTDAVATLLGQPVDVVWSSLEGVPADESGLRTQRIPLDGGRWRESIAAYVVRGNTCVTVTAFDFRPGLRLGNTVNAVFARLDAAKAVSGAHPSP